jgi:glutamate N-acetyltransferase/amino-acid N-acetyltransferase
MKVFGDRSITFPVGFLTAAVNAGIKNHESEKLDLALIYSERICSTAGVFTQNQVKAAPVVLCQERLSAADGGKAQAIVVNSGGANACTGDQGYQDVVTTCRLAAEALHISEKHVLVASTGVIGTFLPMRKIEKGLREIARNLSPSNDLETALAIMTTDTFPKRIAIEVELMGGTRTRIGGISKGVGMIHPNLATLLSFITTDVSIDSRILQRALKYAADRSFNSITVDGDTSTNDAVLVLANGMAGNRTISDEDADYERFVQGLTFVMRELAKMNARDGEGATKFVTIKVEGARSFEDAVKVGRAVAVSPLVKTALFGTDANWGRILSAVGNSGVLVNPSTINLFVGNLMMTQNGTGVRFSEEEAKKALSQKEIEIRIELNLGKEAAEVYTCDFSYDYVKINADYRT